MRLSRLVQIPAVSYDDLPPPPDDRWLEFGRVLAFLEGEFPLVHQNLHLTKVNTYGLLYEWRGSDQDLKPMLLMSHLDVVPVVNETLSQWHYPPFSGHFDGTRIWGRGASDTKNTLLAIYEAIELLLEAGFAPKRTVLLSFGFDEEISGFYGALPLSQVIEERFGRNSVEFIVDEGSVVHQEFGVRFAAIATSEKGYLDTKMHLTVSGGHSSFPPAHTGIGIMSRLVSAIEDVSRPLDLHEDNPVRGLMQCIVKHGQPPKSLRQAVLNDDWDAVAKHFSSQGIAQYLVRTSSAVDLFHGGVKANQLPESVEALVNQRINIGHRLQEEMDHTSEAAVAVAEEFGLTLNGFGRVLVNGSKGELSLEASRALEYAPTSVTTRTSWAYMGGIIRRVLDVPITPALMYGNTDTKYYWNLTDSIYRYTPGSSREGPTSGHAHTVNEFITQEGHMQAVEFYHELIRGGGDF